MIWPGICLSLLCSCLCWLSICEGKMAPSHSRSISCQLDKPSRESLSRIRWLWLAKPGLQLQSWTNHLTSWLDLASVLPSGRGGWGQLLWTIWTESRGGIVPQRKLLLEKGGIGCRSTKNNRFINSSHPVQYPHPILQHPLSLNRPNKWLSTFYLELTFHEHSLCAKHLLDKITLSSHLHFVNEL